MENKLITQKFSSIDFRQMLNLQRKDQQFTDVTLAVNGGNLLAHKNVLSANSNYFSGILSKLSQCHHPTIVLSEVSIQIMSDLLECIYIGQVMILQKDLEEFVRAAESLEIQLALPPLATSEPNHVVKSQNSGSTASFAANPENMPFNVVPSTSSVLKGQAGVHGSSQDALAKKPKLPCEVCGQLLASASSLCRHRKLHTGVKPYKCAICGRSMTLKYNLMKHIKIHFKPQGLYSLVSMANTFKTFNANNGSSP